MSPIAIVLLLLLLAVILFATEKLPVDIVGIILVIGLVITGILTVQEGVSGFGDNIIITIAGLFILTGGLVKTGLVDLIGRRLYRIAGDNEFLLLFLIMLIGTVSSTFMNNTTAAAMLIPFVLGLAERAKIAPSKLLMPLAFGTILGGSCLLIGTSTNLAVSGAMQRFGMEPYTMFELTPVGVIVALLGILYMLFIGRKILPARGGEESLTEQYAMREYISEVIVLRGSHLIGKTIAEADINLELDLNVLGIIRGDEQRIAPRPNERIEADDLLIVEGKLANILNVKAEAGLEIKPDFKLNDRDLESDEIDLFEVMVMRDSRFVGQTLKSLNFRQEYNLTVLAINRHGETFLEKISSVRIKFGDVLLVQGNRRLIEPLVGGGELMLLEDVSSSSMRTEKRRWAIAAFGVFLTLSLSGTFTGIQVPLAIAVLIGVLVLLATKTIRYGELYPLIDFRLLVLIATMMSFGTAMEKTGTDKYLAGLIEVYFGQLGATGVLAGFFLLTVILTQPMSNQAAALVVLPVAIQTALILGLNPRTFAVIITYAASFSFMTPLEPACVLVYTPGRYKFMDFVKVGTFLTIIVFIVSIILVPLFWRF
ncbi:MAG TPA: SLC13 family permease [Pyrinomonadaceae bacterium]|nr:SLC13 family permease [Pyrinomonadaceae bacterium]